MDAAAASWEDAVIAGAVSGGVVGGAIGTFVPIPGLGTAGGIIVGVTVDASAGFIGYVMLLTDTGVVLGEEILPPFKKKFLENIREEYIWLSEEFVIYPERKGGSKEFFVMPPVSFPEVEQMGMKDVVSCSPSAPSDMMLREMHGYQDDAKLASILIGFDCDENIL